MAVDKVFGELLTQGIKIVAAKLQVTKGEIEARIAEAQGYSLRRVQQWQDGHLPTQLDQVAYLALYCISNGQLGCEWARKLLAHAKYPYPESESILEQCCGPSSPEPTISPVFHNLKPREGDFLGREEEIARTQAGLAKRWPLVSIEGMAGIGKTELAKEIAYRYVDITAPFQTPFRAVVWISAKDQPQRKQWLHEVINTTARVLRHYYINQMHQNRRREELINKLRGFPTLIIIDNFETIEDPELIDWIGDLPEDTKVLITSRHAQLRGAWGVELRGLPLERALELIRRHVERLAIPESLVKASDMNDLVNITGGNPLAIELALGHVRKRRSLRRVVEQLLGRLNAHNAESLDATKQTTDDVIDVLFTDAWARLSADGRNTWLSITLFAAAANREAIGDAAQLTAYHRDTALDQLSDMFLLDVRVDEANEHQHFTLHPLARAYARGHLDRRPPWEKSARQRLAIWYVSFARTHGGQDWSNWADFKLLTSELDNIMEVGRWLEKQADLKLLRELADACREMFNVTGYWHDREELLNGVLQLARRRLSDADVAWALTQLSWTWLLTYRLNEARAALDEAQSIAKNLGNNYLQAVIKGNQSYLEEFEGNYDEAVCCNEEEARLVMHSDIDDNLRDRLLAETSYQQGRIEFLREHWEEARRLFEKAVALGEAWGFERAVAYALNWLADLALRDNRRIEVRQLLDRAWDLIRPWNDRRRMAYLRFSEAQLAALDREIERARVEGKKALQEFESLGMTTDVSKAREWLRKLEVENAQPTLT
jgi:tetratricopeptide (TPR) repeat protein